ncbi:hypothetical protein ES708_25118 [subsurface metagenome]
MNVFISYSTQDSAVVKLLAAALYSQPKVDEVHWWDESNIPGEELWPSIFNWINDADIVMVVVTENTIGRAMAIGNEVGYAKGKRKRVVSFVAPGIDTGNLGCLAPDIHIPLDEDKIEAGIERALAYKPRISIRHGNQRVVFNEDESNRLRPLLTAAAAFIIAHWMFDES